jgi:glutathione S-transferase
MRHEFFFLRCIESRAIARYISNKYEDQGTPLFGTTLPEKALVNQWCEVESQHFNVPASLIVGQVAINPLYGLPTDKALVAKQVAKLTIVLDVYECQLAGRDAYLAGGFFSMADLFHIPYMEYLVNYCGKDIQELITSHKNVNTWWTDISSRPSFQKVLALKNKK